MRRAGTAGTAVLTVAASFVAVRAAMSTVAATGSTTAPETVAVVADAVPMSVPTAPAAASATGCAVSDTGWVSVLVVPRRISAAVDTFATSDHRCIAEEEGGAHAFLTKELGSDTLVEAALSAGRHAVRS